MLNKRFPAKRKSKLHLRGDGPFKILEHINDNTYIVDLLGEQNVSTTVNISKLSPFNAGSGLWMNLFEENGNDMIKSAQSIKYLLLVLEKLITRV